MKKGDLRKQEILKTAESLFCRKGYEQTSIQDILDSLNTSKGSFYHHFISKEAVLEGICKKRAEQIYQTALASLDDSLSVPHNLNILLSGMIPLRDEKLTFLMMLLPIFKLPEGKMVRLGYCNALAEQFYSSVAAKLSEGHESGEIYCNNPDISADIVLLLVNRLWVTVCEMIISAEETHTEPDLSEILRQTEQYRLSVEKTAGMPYGSVELLDLNALRMLTVQIHNHWT